MADKAYAYMDWPAIEELVYGECAHPRSLLSPRHVKEGTLYQCFFPGAEEVFLVEESGVRHPMVREDDAGYFACVLSGKTAVKHHYSVDGSDAGDPYACPSLLTAEEESRFMAGISLNAGKMLGGRAAEYNGTKGIQFALWAPGAVRASVVGPFCRWDGRACPMEFHEDSGIYELFIPGLEKGTEYKYELRLPDGLVYTRPDPYGKEFRTGEDAVTIVSDASYRWHDRDYLKSRREVASAPLAACEISLLSWCARKEERSGVSYRTLAEEIGEYISGMGYTHIELTPVMEYPDDASGGYHTSGYFAPTSRYGSPADFKYFVDHMHGLGIGVILDFTPAQFSPDTRWLASFDGTCLYEHLDPRQGIHPIWGTRLFNHGRNEVRSFLLSAAMYWLREYHIDGLRLDGCSTMIRLDYARGSQWVANLFGTSENLEGIDFLKAFSTAIKREYPEVILSLEEDTDWPGTTEAVEEEGLGFDYKWNYHFTRDVIRYLSLAGSGKRKESVLLTRGMLHNYLARLVNSLSRGIGVFDRPRFLSGVEGSPEGKMSVIRAAYVYLFTHPGAKLLAEGEEFSSKLLKDLLALYRSETALFKYDDREDGFEWINTMNEEHSVLAFLRKGDTPEETLLVLCNFTDESFSQYKAGVPFAGKYKEILNTDDVKYGGTGKINPRAKSAKPVPADERDYSLRMRIAPRSAAIIRFQGDAS